MSDLPIHDDFQSSRLCELASSEIKLAFEHGPESRGNAVPRVSRSHSVRLFAKDRCVLVFATRDGSRGALPDAGYLDDLLRGSSPDVLVVGVARPAVVTVTVEIRDRPPGDRELGRWGHVVEVGLDLSTGFLGLGSTLATLPEPIPATPSWHRVRICTRRTGSLDESEDSNEYRLILWPVAASSLVGPVVLKRAATATTGGERTPFAEVVAEKAGAAKNPPRRETPAAEEDEAEEPEEAAKPTSVRPVRPARFVTKARRLDPVDENEEPTSVRPVRPARVVTRARQVDPDDENEEPAEPAPVRPVRPARLVTRARQVDPDDENEEPAEPAPVRPVRPARLVGPHRNLKPAR